MKPKAVDVEDRHPQQEGPVIELSARQTELMRLVRERAPITGEQLAEELGISKPTIRSDLALLVMLGFLDAKPKVGYFLGEAAGGGNARLRLDGMKVREVQGLPVVVRETTPIHDAVVTLFLENVGDLVVCDEAGALRGIVSPKDLLKLAVGNPSAGTMPVGMVMTRTPNVFTVSPDDDVLEAARLMIRHEVDSLPVVVPLKRDGDGETGTANEVVGRITKTMMTKLLLQLAAES